LKTSNGGVLWSSITSGTSNPLEKITFVNLITGIVVGTNGTILRTTNSGLNWISINVTSTNLRSIFFLDANTG
jgi:photosystem II stability/assembly factor-like uncharacterized protein